MLRSLVTLVLFVCVCRLSQAEDEKLYKCSAWGDPHFTKFPSDENDEPAEVWCQEKGLLTMVKNRYLQGSIRVTEKPYVISDFNYVFFDDEGVPICTINGNQFTSPPDCGDDIKVTKNGEKLTVEYKKRDIVVHIDRFEWNNPLGKYGYSIWLWQSSYLVDQSTGLCTTSCDANTGKALRRRIRAATNDRTTLIQNSASSICQSYISKLVPEFKNTALDRADAITRNAYTSCVTDLQTTGELSFAKVTLEALAINLGTKDLTTNSDVQKIIKDTIAMIKEATGRLDSETTLLKPSLAGGSTLVFDENANAAISCRQSWAGEIHILSASYESRSPSCSLDVTSRVKKLCASSPRFCQFKVTDDLLQNESCAKGGKQLKVTYRCSK